MNLRPAFETIWQPALLLVVASLYATPGLTPYTAPAIPAFLPLGIALVGMVLGWRFQRSCALYALIALVCIYAMLGQLDGQPPSTNTLGQILYAGAAVLLPINLAVFAYLEERGLFSRWGLIRLILLLAQVGLIYLITHEAPPSLQDQAAVLLHFRLMSSEMDKWTYLPQPALIAFTLSFIAIAVRLLMTAAPLVAGLLGAMIASTIALHLAGNPLAIDAFLTAAMAIITAAVIQDTFRMAFIDELTGIPGRRALVSDMKRLGGRYVIAMADIDHFKKFNDTHGHDVGDQVLQMVADRLSKISGGGKAYRYGGEEFTFLMPGKNVDTALKHLDAVRQLVEQSSFHIRDKERPKKKSKTKPTKSSRNVVSVAVSIGVAEPKSTGDKPEAVLKAADQALYRAKEAGRNQVAR